MPIINASNSIKAIKPNFFGWSCFFDGNSYLNISNVPASNWKFLHELNTKYTIEFWIYNRNSGSEYAILDTHGSTSSKIGFSVSKFINDKIRFIVSNGSGGGTFVVDAFSSDTLPINEWTHVAITYDNSLSNANCKIYLDGILDSTHNKSVTKIASSNNPAHILSIGNYNTVSTGLLSGNVADLHIIKNFIYYTDKFNIRLFPIEVTNYTDFLTFQDGKFIDNSTNNYTISSIGNPKMVNFSPFKNKKFTIKALNDSVSTFYGIPKSISIISNDLYTGYKTNSLIVNSYTINTPNSSIISTSTNKKQLIYTPKEGFFGVDSFDYSITDGNIKSNTATASVSVFCNPPIIVDKSFVLKDNTIYNLDIQNPNCHPGEILFNGGQFDRDGNSPAQKISIVPNSIVCTGNIQLISYTNTVITFKTNSINSNVASTALTYKIKNEKCELDNTQTFDLVKGGSISNPSTNVVTTNTINAGIITKLSVTPATRYLRSSVSGSVPTDYTMSVYADPVSLSDLSDRAGWFGLFFYNYTVPDRFFIIMRGNPILNQNGTFTERPTLYRGDIGLVSFGGCFIFYKPLNYKLELWSDTAQAGSLYIYGIADLFDPTTGKQYTDENSKPNSTQITNCSNYIRSTISDPTLASIYVYNSSTDYTNTYTGTSKPSWA